MLKYNKIAILLILGLVIFIVLFITYLVFSKKSIPPNDRDNTQLSPTINVFPTDTPTKTPIENIEDGLEFSKPEGMTDEYYNDLLKILDNIKSLKSFTYDSQVHGWEWDSSEAGYVDNENHIWYEYDNFGFIKHDISENKTIYTKKPGITKDPGFTFCLDYLKSVLLAKNNEFKFQFNQSPTSIYTVKFSDLEFAKTQNPLSYQVSGKVTYYSGDGKIYDLFDENGPFLISLSIDSDFNITSIESPNYIGVMGGDFYANPSKYNFYQINKKIDISDNSIVDPYIDENESKIDIPTDKYLKQEGMSDEFYNKLIEALTKFKQSKTFAFQHIHPAPMYYEAENVYINFIDGIEYTFYKELKEFPVGERELRYTINPTYLSAFEVLNAIMIGGKEGYLLEVDSNTTVKIVSINAEYLVDESKNEYKIKTNLAIYYPDGREYRLNEIPKDGNEFVPTTITIKINKDGYIDSIDTITFTPKGYYKGDSIEFSIVKFSRYNEVFDVNLLENWNK